MHASTNSIRVDSKSTVLIPGPHVELLELRASVESLSVKSNTSQFAPRASCTGLDHYVLIPDHTYRVLDLRSDSLAYWARVLGPKTRSETQFSYIPNMFFPRATPLARFRPLRRTPPQLAKALARATGPHPSMRSS